MLPTHMQNACTIFALKRVEKHMLTQGTHKTRIGSDRIGSDWTGLTKPGPDPKKSDRHKFPPK